MLGLSSILISKCCLFKNPNHKLNVLEKWRKRRNSLLVSVEDRQLFRIKYEINHKGFYFRSAILNLYFHKTTKGSELKFGSWQLRKDIPWGKMVINFHLNIDPWPQSTCSKRSNTIEWARSQLLNILGWFLCWHSGQLSAVSLSLVCVMELSVWVLLEEPGLCSTENSVTCGCSAP